MSDYGWKFLWSAAFFISWTVLCSRAMKRQEYDAVVLYALFALSSLACMTVWLYLLITRVSVSTAGGDMDTRVWFYRNPRVPGHLPALIEDKGAA